MKYVINPHLFYSSHSLGDLNYHSCCSVLHIDDPHMYITRQYSLSVLQTIFPPECPMEPQSHPIPNRVYRLLPKAGTSGFFTVVTGTPTHPIKPSTWEPPIEISSSSIHVQVVIFSLF